MFFFFRHQSKKRARFFFLFSSTMDQGGSSLGLTPFVRCLLIIYYWWILFVLFKWFSNYLFERSQSFLFLLEGAEFGSLWAPKLSTEQIFLNNRHTQHWYQSARGWADWEKSFHPSRILVISHSRMAQGTPKFYSSRAQRAFIGLFVVVEGQCSTAFLCWLEWGL